MKTYRNHHTRNRTRRRGMKGGTYADDLTLITKYSDIGARDPLEPLDMRPSLAELTSMERIVKSYPVTDDLKVRFLTTLANVNKTANRGAGYGQPLKLPLAIRFAGELAELKAVVIANRPAERQASSDFYLPLQSLHRIAFDFSNSLTPADQDKLLANKAQYESVKFRTNGKQPVDQYAANEELLGSIDSFVPQLGEWFRGLSRLKNVQIAARPAERERLFDLLPDGLKHKDELKRIFDAYSARIKDLYVNLSTSAALGNQAALAKPVKPERKVVEVRPDEPLPPAVPSPAPPVFGAPRPDVRADPAQLPEAPPLAAAPLQEVTAPPPRGLPARGFNAVGDVPRGVQSIGLGAAPPPSASSPAAVFQGPQDIAPRPKVNPVYVAQPAPEPTAAPASQLPLPPPTRFNPLDKKFTPPAPKPYNPFQSYPGSRLESRSLPSPGEQPQFSLLNTESNASPAGLTTQETPISGLYANEKGFGTKSLCERLHPELYQILKTGQFNGKSITTLLNEQGPELQAFFAEIQFDVAAKTLMGHPIPEIYKACHPDRTIADPNLTTIFQTLQALYNYTGVRQPIQSIEGVDPDDEYYWAVDDPRWHQDDSSEALKRLMSLDFKFPKANVPSLDEVLAMIKPTVDQAKLKEIQIEHRKAYIKNHIRKFIKETIEKCTDYTLALRRQDNMGKLLDFLINGYPFKLSSTVVQQIKDVIHDEPGKGAIESKTLRFFLNSVVKVIQARNIQELNQRLIETKQVVHALFYQEQWCAKPNVALDVKQEIYRGSLKAKWIDTTKQGLTLTSDPIRPDKAGGIPSKTITISRGDCFSFNPDGVRTCAPKYVFKESKNHFTVENITEVPTGFSLSILQYLSGSVVRSSRFIILLIKSLDITCFVNGIVKKDCPAGVGLTKQTPDLPNDCPKKLLDAQYKLVASETTARNNERRATTCEADLAKLRAELDEALQKNQADTAKLAADISREQAKLADLQASKDRIAAELAALREKKDLMQGHLNEFGGQLKKARRVKSDLEAQIGVLKEEKAGSESQNEINARRLAGLRGQYEASLRQQDILRGQFAEAQAQLREAEVGIADLNSRFATTDALIRAADEQIRKELGDITEIIGEGVEELTAGLDIVIGLANDTRSQIAESRADFTVQFTALRRQLEDADVARRSEIVQAIQSLKEVNQASMAALQGNLASALAENARLQGLYAREQAAKAQMEGQLAAKNAAIDKNDRDHAEALQAARQAAADTAAQVQAAKDGKTAAEVAKLQLEYASTLDELSNKLAAAVARAQIAEVGNKERENLAAELARVNATIAAIPPPYVPPPAAPVIAPEITGREPPVGTPAPQGSNITIQWDAHGTPAPWILRIDYDGANPDFQEVTAEGPIVYTVKRPGALSGRIYSVTIV